ncbi:MAG: hypothetical protein IKY52_13610 [Clostridia bacterium]|nr:hypothetical protein [Clostridia bacterium]
MKKALALLLCVMMTVCLGLTVPVSAAEEYSVWDGSIETDWLKESEKVHTIDSAAKLAGLAKLTNDAQIGGSTGAYEGHTFYITVNIDLNNKEWTPIGTNYGINFAGNLEGKLGGVEGAAPTIKNFSLTNTEGHGNTGFIGTLRGGSVKNLIFENASVSYIDGSSLGIVVGYMSKVITAFENITVINSNVKSTATRQDEGIGGVVGYAKIDKALNFKNIAFINGSVEGAIVETGGIIGYARVNVENELITFENCYVSGSVKGNAGNAGGIAGKLQVLNDSDVFTMKNVQTENLTVNASTAGSLFGQTTGGTVVVENALLINSTASVADDAVAAVDATDCFANKDDVVCLTRTDAELTDLAAKDALSSFDFGGVWTARVGKPAILTLAMGADDVEAGVAADAGAVDAGSAPQTFDMGIVAVAAAIVSAAGYMLTKKR